MNKSNNTEWLIQPKRVCQTWFLLLSYLRHKWSRGEETGLISEKTSNPWAPYVEKSISDFERGLTPRAADEGDSQPPIYVFSVRDLSTKKADTKPALHH